MQGKKGRDENILIFVYSHNSNNNDHYENVMTDQYFQKNEFCLICSSFFTFTTNS